MKLEGKVALITGSATGMGRETALLFGQEGAKVVVADCSERGKETSEAICAAGGEAVFVQGDVSRASSAEEMVETVIERFGKLDIVHNNAGILLLADTIADTTEANWDRTIDVNLKGVYLVSKFAIPHLIANGGGAIVNTASMTGWVVGMVGLAAYCASKAGVVGLTKCMALELGRYGIRVNCVCPGVIDTSLFPTQFLKTHTTEELEAGNRAFAQSIPQGRYGDAEEVARAVLYLASDEASYVTGQALVVDGGFSSQ